MNVIPQSSWVLHYRIMCSRLEHGMDMLFKPAWPSILSCSCGFPDFPLENYAAPILCNTLKTVRNSVLFSPASAWASPTCCYIPGNLNLQKSEASTKKQFRALSSCKYYSEDPFLLVPGTSELVCFQAWLFSSSYLTVSYLTAFHSPSFLLLWFLLLLF